MVSEWNGVEWNGVEWRIGGSGSGSGACASHPPTSHHDRLIVRTCVEGTELLTYHTKTGKRNDWSVRLRRG